MDTTKDKKVEENIEEKNKVRITLTSKKMKNVEAVAKDLIKRAKEKDVRVQGPKRMPTKNLVLKVRKSPCGEGTNTYERFEMRIYKRVIDLECTSTDIREITSMKIDSGVEVELTINTD